MESAPTAHRVRIYLTEDGPVAAILETLRRGGCAGASAFRGIAGFGVHGQIHVASLVDLSGPLPVVVEWVDTRERIERCLPALLELVDGLITIEDVGVVKWPHPVLREVPAQLRVRDVMTPCEKVDAVTPEADLYDVVRLLLRKRRNAIPVVDEEQRVVGMITNSDLVTRAGLPLRLELLRALGEVEEPRVATHLAALEGEGRTAAMIMTPNVVTISQDTPLADAARLMLTRRLKRLPVVDEHGRFVGIVSRFDILKTVTVASAPSERPAARRLYPIPRRVGEIMSRDVPMVHADASLADVLNAVMATRLHRAVVVDEEGRPIGGIVDTDLLQRVTPTAHAGLIAALMRRVRPHTPEEQAIEHLRTAQRAHEVMRPVDQLLVVPADAPIADVIDQALARRVKMVIVTDPQGRVIGMADRADLLGALAAAM
jgi:CBS domain-containing protein